MMRGSQPKASISIRSAECRRRSPTRSNPSRPPTSRAMVEKSRGWLRSPPPSGDCSTVSTLVVTSVCPGRHRPPPHLLAAAIVTAGALAVPELRQELVHLQVARRAAPVPHPDRQPASAPASATMVSPRLLVRDGRTAVEFPFVVNKPHGRGDNTDHRKAGCVHRWRAGDRSPAGRGTARASGVA